MGPADRIRAPPPPVHDAGAAGSGTTESGEEPGAPCPGLGVELVHPFLAPAFRAALVRSPFVGRTGAFRALVGDVLPDAILARRTKSSFDEAFFARQPLEFAKSWDGSGVDESIVDPEALAAEWRSGQPDARSLLLLQSAWLSRDLRDRREEPLGRRRERAPVLRPA